MMPQTGKADEDLIQAEGEEEPHPALENDTAVEVEIAEEQEAHDLDPTVRYNITTYGWDSDVEGLVKRLTRGDIYIPKFQRGFVWTGPEKSRFVESLILGLPVPTIFLAQDADSKKLNVVDGQQRLRTLQGYLDGKFALSGKEIQEDLRGRYYNKEVAKGKKSKVLDEGDLRTLSDAVIHAIVIKPDPLDNSEIYGPEYNKAIIQIFKRLNTSGKALQQQEVRSSIFHGPLNETLSSLNEDENWRTLFGPVHSRMKDVECILRVCALSSSYAEYSAPMPSFLDGFMSSNREMNGEKSAEFVNGFSSLAELIVRNIGQSALKNGSTFLVSRLDAVGVGYLTALANKKTFDDAKFISCWSELLDNTDYQWSIEEFVNDTDRVHKRISTSISIFDK
ncbi:DUF262 domain-containing protein [Agrobacterium deltaense]